MLNGTKPLPDSMMLYGPCQTLTFNLIQYIIVWGQTPPLCKFTKYNNDLKPGMLFFHYDAKKAQTYIGTVYVVALIVMHCVNQFSIANIKWFSPIDIFMTIFLHFRHQLLWHFINLFTSQCFHLKQIRIPRYLLHKLLIHVHFRFCLVPGKCSYSIVPVKKYLISLASWLLSISFFKLTTNISSLLVTSRVTGEFLKKKQTCNAENVYMSTRHLGHLARYVKLRIAHAPGMSGTFSPPRGLAIPTCIKARASRTCRDVCRDR